MFAGERAGRIADMRQPSLQTLTKQITSWNAAHPVGIAVQYHPVMNRPEFRERVTKSEAFILSGHTACIWLQDERGCVALDACKPVGTANAPGGGEPNPAGGKK